MPSEIPNSGAELLARYEHQPVLRGLVQLVPFSIGSAIESALLTQLNRYREERMRAFFDELGSGRMPLSEELTSSNDFLHCYFATLNAALRSRRVEKVRFLARLLRGGFDGRVADVDEYEELVGITDDLSYRELRVLALLHEKERLNPIEEGENELQRASRFWPAFVVDAQSRLGVSEPLLRALLVRLQRSGCYEEFTGSFFSYTGGKGRTTELYRRLATVSGQVGDDAA